MSRKQRTLQFPSTLESTHSLHHYSYSQSLSFTSADISFHEDEFGVPTFDHGEQQHSLYLTDTVVDHSNSEEEYDDMSNLGGQLTAMEINTPDDDWPQDPYQAHQPYETMAADTFIVDSSGTTVAYVDPAASPNSDYSYFHGYNDYDYYNEHFDSISSSIHAFDTPMTPADYSNATTSNSSTHPYHQQ